MKLEPFNGIFGLPPSTYVSDDMIINSMPVAEFTPCKPNFDRGLTFFRINPDWETYTKILSNVGFEIEQPLRIAFIADNFPTDSFTNEYGESFLQKVTDVASEGVQQLVQMTGSQRASEAGRKLGKQLAEAGEAIGGGVGSAVGAAGKGLGGAATSLGGLADQLRNQEAGLGKIIGGGAVLVDKMLAGHRIDFPNMWRNSGYSPSYTLTVRLYNPNPGSPKATEKYILGPLAVLLCLAIPRTTDGNTYNWPFFHKVRTNGIWWLNPGVITNISVIKGGDQQQIAYNQKLAIVDVRIDFGSLYTSMMVEEGDTKITHRPTVRRYIDELRDNKPVFTREWLRRNAASRAGFGSDITLNDRSFLEEESLFNNDVAARQAQTTQDTTLRDRTNAVTASTQADLDAQNRQKGFPS
jgi:hypothetical protein